MVGREGRSGEGGSGEEGRRGWESNQVQTLSYGLAAVVECLVMGL